MKLGGEGEFQEEFRVEAGSKYNLNRLYSYEKYKKNLKKIID